MTVADAAVMQCIEQQPVGDGQSQFGRRRRQQETVEKGHE